MKHRKKKIGLAVLLVLAVALIGVRIYLPYYVKDYVNAQINALKGYGGGVADIDLHLWRGAYALNGLEIHKTNGGVREPFVSAKSIDLSIEWRALWHRKVVAEIDMYGAELNFARSQTGEGAGWPKLVDALSPFDINRLSVHNSKVAFVDHNAKPDVDIFLNITNAQVTNLRNVEGEKGSLPSDLSVRGSSIGGGKMAINGHINILRDIPDFDINGKLVGANVMAFNDYTQSWLAMDFEGGTISLYTELAAANGHVQGYLKAIAKDLKIIETHDNNPINAIWQAMVAGFADLFRNHSKDQFALRLPIEGDLNNPEQDGWAAFLSIFRNAFGKAFAPDMDGNVSFKKLLEESDK